MRYNNTKSYGINTRSFLFSAEGLWRTIKFQKNLLKKVLDSAFSTVSDFGIKLIWTLIILSIGFKISKYLVKWTKKFWNVPLLMIVWLLYDVYRKDWF